MRKMEVCLYSYCAQNNGASFVRRVSTILCLMMILISTQASSDQQYCRNDKGNYTINSTYRANLDALDTGFRSVNDNGKGFFNFSIGQSPAKVYLTGLCRGDIGPNNCRACLIMSTILLTRACPVQMEAIAGEDQCAVRYSNRSLIGHMESNPRLYSWNDKNVSSAHSTTFFKELRALLGRLRSKASGGGALRKYAAGNTSVPEFGTTFASAQCSPDLSMIECNNCLDEAFEDIDRNYGRTGGRVVTPSCNFRYEVYLFYGEEAAYDSESHPNTELFARAEKESKTFGTGATILGCATIGLIVSVGVYSRVRKRSNKPETPEVRTQSIDGSFHQFDLGSISRATDNFSQKNIIEETEFYAVFKGTHSDGSKILVKWERYIENLVPEFLQRRLTLISTIHHHNLLRLLDFHIIGNYSYICVYEYLPYRLDRVLSGIEKLQLDWKTRLNIIQGIASGLCFLHDDVDGFAGFGVSASKVFIDGKLNPKISNSWNIHSQKNRENSDPNNLRASEFDAVDNVLGFGLLIFQIISGNKIRCYSDQQHAISLLIHTRRELREETALATLVDEQMEHKDRYESEIMGCLQIGLMCVRRDIADRPTMRTVVYMLNCIYQTLSIFDILLELDQSHAGKDSLKSSESENPSDCSEHFDDDSNSGFTSASNTSLSPSPYVIASPEIENYHVIERPQDFVRERNPNYFYLTWKLVSWRWHRALFRF